MIIIDRTQKARELGLPTNTSWMLINLYEHERQRALQARALGLSEYAHWNEVDAAAQTAKRRKLADRLGMRADAGWVEINIRIFHEGAHSLEKSHAV